MARDRLAELREKGQIRETDGDNNSQSNSKNSNPIPRKKDKPVEIQMDKFLGQLEDLRQLLSELKGFVQSVKIHHTSILSQPSADKKEKGELDKLTTTIKTRSQQIRNKLKDLEKGIIREEQQNKNGTPAQLRIQKTQHSALLHDFVDTMTTYQKAQVDYCDRCKERIKHQLNITETKMSEDEVEDIIEEGNFSIFTQGILVDAQTMLDVQLRHNDILELEKGLRELSDLFLEMAILVDGQGEVVDRIEGQVRSTQEYAETGKEQLKQAKSLKKKARKKKIIIGGVVVVILIVVGAVIFVV